MKNLSTVLIAGAVAGVVSVAAHLLLESARETQGAPPSAAPGESIEAQLARLAETQAEMAKKLSDLGNDVDMRLTSSGRTEVIDPASIEAAVERWLAANATGASSAGNGKAVAAPAAQSNAAAMSRNLETALDFLLDPDVSGFEKEQLWHQLSEEGRLDEVIAFFEERAAAAPDDPDVQVDLGEAYIRKIQEVGQSPLAGMWATKADKAFDTALATDPTHWDARFNKAVSLSFWPPLFGKQGEAIRHFEILVQQQEGMALGSEHKQTYLLLGNMYQQIGNAEKAYAAWQKGLAHFPGDEELMAQLDLAQDH